MAHRSDRRGEAPITALALEAVEQRLAPRARISMMARSDRLSGRGRRYVCSLTTVLPIVTLMQSHGAPPASRPRRRRRCASRSLDPCSRRGLNTTMRRRHAFVAVSTGGLYRTFHSPLFLDGGAQIRPVSQGLWAKYADAIHRVPTSVLECVRSPAGRPTSPQPAGRVAMFVRATGLQRFPPSRQADVE